MTRIELALSAWEADVLPLNYTRRPPKRQRPQPTGRSLGGPVHLRRVPPVRAALHHAKQQRNDRGADEGRQWPTGDSQQRVRAAEPMPHRRRLTAMRGRRAGSTAAPLLLLPLLLSACGSEPSPDPVAQPQSQPPPVATPQPTAAGHVNAVPAGYDGDFRFAGAVLESPDHGPQLCTIVQESYPPQCGGPDVVGWDWDDIDADSANGTTWGNYALVGRWDGSRFTLTQRPRIARGDDRGAGRSDVDLTSPCPEQAGGWRPIDDAKATDAALTTTIRRAESMPGFAGAWLDQSYLEGSDDPDLLEREANDPTRLVLNVQFTDDLAAREQDLRQTWGGALCVSRVERSEAELSRILRELRDRGDFLPSGTDTQRNTVLLEVWVADAELLADIEERYGRGAVQLIGILEPVDL